MFGTLYFQSFRPTLKIEKQINKDHGAGEMMEFSGW